MFPTLFAKSLLFSDYSHSQLTRNALSRSVTKRADNFDPDLTPLDFPDVHPSYFHLCCRLQLSQGGHHFIPSIIFSFSFLSWQCWPRRRTAAASATPLLRSLKCRSLRFACFPSFPSFPGFPSFPRFPVLRVWRVVLCGAVHNNFPRQTFVTVPPKLIRTDPVQTFQVGPTSLRLEPLYIKVKVVDL